MDDREFDRVVAIGDLNGAFTVLREILLGTGIIDDHERWIGGRTHFIQLGDIFDRGGGVCASLALLQRLQREAPERGGKVTVVLGNHEVMTAGGDDRWITTEEYLWFATSDEQRGWSEKVESVELEFKDALPRGSRDLLLELELERWMRGNAPGQEALMKALAPTGVFGAFLRTLPVAVATDGCVLCHGGVTPRWAELGVDGLNRAAADDWQRDRGHTDDRVLRAEDGPLWYRGFALRQDAATRSQLEQSLNLLGAERMIVGHTPTANIPGGDLGRIAVCHDGLLICLDVALGCGMPGAALIIEDGVGSEWLASGSRLLWQR